MCGREAGAREKPERQFRRKAVILWYVAILLIRYDIIYLSIHLTFYIRICNQLYIYPSIDLFKTIYIELSIQI